MEFVSVLLPPLQKNSHTRTRTVFHCSFIYSFKNLSVTLSLIFSTNLHTGLSFGTTTIVPAQLFMNI